MSASQLNPAFAPSLFRQERPDWARDGKDWPNRDSSRFVAAGGLRWHVQIMGSGPVALLVHGTGAATHSWADVAPILAADFTVIAVDLPGHGFTTEPPRTGMSLPGMANALAALLAALEAKPAIAIGHSAGAAILVQMCLDGSIVPKTLVSLNGALWPFKGAARPIFQPLAKLFALNPLVPMLFSWHAADPKVVDRLLLKTGSSISPRQAGFYARLAARSGHAKAALTMMANWALEPLIAALPGLTTPLLLVTGSQDHSIPPGDAIRIRAILPAASHISLPGLGHLAHEEQPAECAALITDFARQNGVFAA